MQKLYAYACLLFATIPVFGQTGVREVDQATFRTLVQKAAAPQKKRQNEDTTQQTTPESESITNKINKGLNFGVSLGFSRTFDRVYEARISPLDNKLKIDPTSRTSFLLSTGVVFPISRAGMGHQPTESSDTAKSSPKKGLGGRFFQETGSDDTPTGKGYFVPYGFYALATVNLVTFNSAASGSLYNQKIDGGLGLGYRLNDNVLVAATFEMISYRTPRDFLVNDYNNQVLTNAAGTVITGLSQDDNDYFTTRYMPSVSLKFFYLFAFDPVQ